MTTLNELMQEYGGNAFVLADDGNGCGFGGNGVTIDYDEDSASLYGNVEMNALDGGHVSEDGVLCEFASDWIIKGEGDNPYRVRLFF